MRRKEHREDAMLAEQSTTLLTPRAARTINHEFDPNLDPSAEIVIDRTGPAASRDDYDLSVLNDNLSDAAGATDLREDAEPTPREVEQSVEAWIRKAGPVPLLTHAQEIELARRIEQARTQADYERARNAFISANLRLVAS